MNTSLNYPLQRLSDAESWNFFKQIAFARGGAMETADLVVIGKEIVKKCHGLPLAIKVIGSLMYSKESKNDWLLVQNSQLWNLEDGTNSVLQSLKLSYDHLSFPLKRCFSFCSFYPKDEEIQKNELIQSWMALGLLQPPLLSGLAMEDVGDNYFKTLLSCSLLEDVKKDEQKAIAICKMHDIVHDLAITTVQTDYSILNSQALVSLQINSKLHLRVLVLDDYLMKNLPDSIKKLKHLRYLDISKTSISVLPNSITRLYNLQTLKIDKLKKVPEDFVNLIKLRHLCVKDIFLSSGCMLTGIGQLTCLQTLSFFTVNPKKGCHIKELAGLKDLRGDLTIYGLEDVESIEESKQALLCEKSRLRTLTLAWRYRRMSGSIDNEDNVFKGLEPHSNVEGLAIKNFKGRNFPPWMMLESHASQVLGNLVNLRLDYCDKCERIPPLGHLQHLKVVEINGMTDVESIGPEFYGMHTTEDDDDVSSSSGGFPALRELTLKNLSKLERWAEAVQQQSSGSVDVVPCLKKFYIEGCQSLNSLPNHFPSVTELKIKGINDSLSLRAMSRTLNTLTSFEIEDCKGSEFQSIIEELLGNSNRSLRFLRIAECGQFLYLPENLVALEKLTISDCENLKYIHTVPFAREVEIVRCMEFIGVPSFTQTFPVLEKFVIGNCGNIVEFPDMHSHTCLRELIIRFMPNLTSIPNLCKSLQSLVIFDCGRLTSLPDEQGKALHAVEIMNCGDLVSLPDFRYVQNLRLSSVGSSKGLHCYPWPSSASSNCDIQCLENLTLCGWPEINSLPEQLHHLTALTHLKLESFSGLDSLPDCLGNLASLRYLELRWCKKLKYLPSVEAMRRLTELDELYLSGCPLLSARCSKGTRPEWIKISNIPNIHTDYGVIKGHANTE